MIPPGGEAVVVTKRNRLELGSAKKDAVISEKAHADFLAYCLREIMNRPGDERYVAPILDAVRNVRKCIPSFSELDLLAVAILDADREKNEAKAHLAREKNEAELLAARKKLQSATVKLFNVVCTQLNASVESQAAAALLISADALRSADLYDAGRELATFQNFLPVESKQEQTRIATETLQDISLRGLLRPLIKTADNTGLSKQLSDADRNKKNKELLLEIDGPLDELFLTYRNGKYEHLEDHVIVGKKFEIAHELYPDLTKIKFLRVCENILVLRALTRKDQEGKKRQGITENNRWAHNKLDRAIRDVRRPPKKKSTGLKKM